MNKKHLKVALFIFSVVNFLMLTISVDLYRTSLSETESTEQALVDRNAEVQELKSEVEIYQHDLADTKEQLLISNWKLGQIEARSEGVRYQELEGDGE